MSETSDYPDPRPFDEVMADAVAANEAAGIPDPEVCHGCNGSGTFPTPGPGGWLVGPCLACSDPSVSR